MTPTAFAIWLLLSMSSGAGSNPPAGPVQLEGQFWTERACEARKRKFVEYGRKEDQLLCHRVVVEPKS